MKRIVTLTFVICFSVVAASAQNQVVNIPDDVKPFIEKGSKPIALETADLNGDNKNDFVLVLQRDKHTKTDEMDYPENQRPLLVLVRGKDKKLIEAKRNEKVVYCSGCGGIFGDPFAGISTGKNTFTVKHYGGSAWRWSADYKFNYSRIDNTWQLVRVEKTFYHNVRPMNETLKKTVLTPPKDFGKVDIADFDPNDYEEKVVEGDSEIVAPDYSSSEVNSDEEVFTGYLKNKGDRAMFVVKAEAGYRMKASIIDVETPDEEGPVMIGYVTSPNGDEEGNPGGLFFDEVLKETGDYKIAIKQNEAKSGATNIKFKVKVTVKKETAAFQVLDVKALNQKIAKAAAANEAWVKAPFLVVAHIIEPFSEMGSRTVEMVSPFADVTESLTVTVIDDGYADDSVRGEKFIYELKLDESGVWKVISAKKAQVCQQNRGHQDYSTAPCL